MIENSDRGITLNKTLAWVIVSALVMGAGGVGVQSATLTSGIEALQSDLDAVTRMLASEVSKRERMTDRLTDRVRDLEIRGSARDTSFTNLSANMQEMQQQLKENNRLLIELLRQANSSSN